MNDVDEKTAARRAAKLVAALAAVAVAVSLALPGSAHAYTQKERIVSSGHGTLYSEQYLVVHETANPGATALNHVNYWKTSPYAVHYVMDLDGGTVYHTMSDDRKAWHIGNGNSKAVGIELCHAKTRADFDRQWTEAVKWCGDYLAKRGWSVDRMISHDEARKKWGGTDHTDPNAYFKQYGRTWAQFDAAVAKYMKSGKVSSGGSSGGSSAGASESSSGSGAYVVTASALNVRTGPGTGYREKAYSQLTSNAKAHAYATGALKKGTRVTVSQTSGGWSRIPSGWVCSKYLAKASAAKAATSGSGTYRVDVSGTLNVRSGPGTGYRVTGQLRDGYVLRVSSVSGGWAKYSAYSGTRYVSAKYLDKV